MKITKKISLIILLAMILSALSFNFAVNAENDEVKANPSGAYLRYTVNITQKTDNSLAFSFTVLKKLDYIIQEGDMLEYDVMSLIDEGGWGAVDGDIASVGVLRDSGLKDTEGNGVHTGFDLSEFCYDQWWHRVIILGVTEEENGDKYTAGRKFNNIQIAMHPQMSEEQYQGVVLYDNIVITNNGEVKLVIFKDEGDFDPATVKFSHSQNADKGLIECLVFTPEEEQAMKDKEEAKIKEQESREASKIEAEISKQASIEQSSIDASMAASISEEEAKNNTDAITAAENENENGSESPETESASYLLVIIIAAVAVPVVVVIAVVVVVVSKKKNGG